MTRTRRPAASAKPPSFPASFLALWTLLLSCSFLRLTSASSSEKEDQCRKVRGFTVCEIPHDIPPLPFDRGVPIDLNVSSPSKVLVYPHVQESSALPQNLQRQQKQQEQQPSRFKATISGAPSGAHESAINFCMDRAAENWESDITVTVRVNFSNLGETLVLGTGQPSRNWIINDFICPVALAEAVVGEDLNGDYVGTAQFDILMTLNTQTNWYVGLDAQTPSGRYDLVTVCLHEVYHGLFLSGGNIGVSISQTDLSYLAIFLRETVTGRFDAFMANQDGCNITAYSENPANLGTVLTGNNLWFVSESTRIAKLHAPRPYTPGSSLYHLSETTYGAGSGADGNDLMTPAIGTKYGQHNPGRAVREMQRLVLNVDGRRGADACEVVRAPEVDNTAVEQINVGTGDGGSGSGGSERGNSGLGGLPFGLWTIVGGAGAVAVGAAACGCGVCVAMRRAKKRRAAQAAEAPRRRVMERVDLSRGGNGGGVV